MSEEYNREAPELIKKLQQRIQELEATLEDYQKEAYKYIHAHGVELIQKAQLEARLAEAEEVVEDIARPCPVIEASFENGIELDEELDLWRKSSRRRRDAARTYLTKHRSSDSGRVE